jgi:hypothetical protein
MKHLLLGAFALLLLSACATEVLVGGEAGQGDAGGAGGASATTGPSTTGETSTGTGEAPDGCSTECTANDGSTCSCVRTCTGGYLGSAFTKVACKPNSSGMIECVCTLDSGGFSGACYEKKHAACDFEEGCCANYFSGK